MPDNQSPRDGAVVIANLPTTGDAWVLVDNNGKRFPVVRCGEANGRAFLPLITEEKFFTVQKESAPTPTISITRNGDETQFKIGDREIIAFQGGGVILPDGYDEKFPRGGYLSRLSTPASLLVTNDYPIKHKHHHGLRFAWTRTDFDGRDTDFWNMGKSNAGIQAIDHTPAWTAGSWAGLTYRNRYEDQVSGSTINILEERIAKVARAPLSDDPVIIIDLTVVQHCLTPLPLHLPTYHYGGLGLRGHRA